MIISLINAAKVCPGYGFIHEPENCTSTCSATNDQCPPEEKCCYIITEPCGFHCIVPKDNVEKSGKCPTSSPNDPNWFLCDAHSCDVDNDCQDIRKCCPNSCGSPICMTPK
ncbi:unnamed protein product [Rotaria sordida]|uniref:WAP domain-containing protein n=1 Tax=Rotaria sordida TaxID=392033 RepID=A0A815VLZ4_9BILA|nr:unnamed protein product [Rotaria sordida]CAF3661428.1 unnamed protein product [Rotaria sordida]